MSMINSITGVFLIVMGFLVKKYPNLIAGYNTMSAEQKEKVDINGLSTHMRNSMVVMGGLIVIGDPILNLIGLKEHGIAVLIAITLIGTFYMLIIAQTYSNSYKEYRPIKKIIRIATKSVIFVLLASITFGLLYYGTRPTEISINGRQLEISGVYGMIDNIKTIDIRESIPRIKKKTNGFNYGSTLKGSFELEEIGNCKLFIESEKGPYIYLETESGTLIIINTESRSKTEELFDELKSKSE